jgi:D-alanyl-D-alanine carboxypeptidase
MKRAALAGVAIAAAIATGVSPAGAAPPTVKTALAKLVQAGAPGAVVLVHNGSATTVFTDGVAVLSTRTPIAAIDHFRIGSITKSFVAAVVLELVREGKLALDEPIAEQVPGVLPRGSKISVRELLQHTSGLYNYTDSPKLFAPYLKGNLGYRWSPRAMLALALSQSTLAEPGETWSYSNTNYIVLGLAVEAVTKHSLGAELASRIFRPLHLTQTTFAVGREIGNPAAHAYYKGQDITTLSGSWAWAAGAIASTAADVANFYRTLFTGKLLPPTQLRAMERTVVAGGNDYGLGLLEVTTPCGSAWGHNGSVPGYMSYALSSKNGQRQAVVLATTRMSTVSAAYDAALNDLVGKAFCN